MYPNESYFQKTSIEMKRNISTILDINCFAIALEVLLFSVC